MNLHQISWLHILQNCNPHCSCRENLRCNTGQCIKSVYAFLDASTSPDVRNSALLCLSSSLFVGKIT
jgi:hypothetical protein